LCTIRTGVGSTLPDEWDAFSQHRLSDFQLWESAYAELVFTRTMWPDFDESTLAAAVREFHGRERRFGTVPQAPVYRQQAWLD
jgi:undecaprenyl diphosphate synthase